MSTIDLIYSPTNFVVNSVNIGVSQCRDVCNIVRNIMTLRRCIAANGHALNSLWRTFAMADHLYSGPFPFREP